MSLWHGNGPFGFNIRINCTQGLILCLELKDTVILMEKEAWVIDWDGDGGVFLGG